MKESALGSPAEFFMLLVALSRLLQWEISHLNVLPARPVWKSGELHTVEKWW